MGESFNDEYGEKASKKMMTPIRPILSEGRGTTKAWKGNHLGRTRHREKLFNDALFVTEYMTYSTPVSPVIHELCVYTAVSCDEKIEERVPSMSCTRTSI
ncbi:hypothetical protein ACFE04_000015 [Oxalis oulophora]